MHAPCYRAHISQQQWDEECETRDCIGMAGGRNATRGKVNDEYLHSLVSHNERVGRLIEEVVG